jgi:type IV secretion system protein VirD4
MPATRRSTPSSSWQSAAASTSSGQRSMAPLITALVETIADTARRRAATSPGGRRHPPLGLFIDEAAQIGPLPSLPSLLADGGGQGIVTFVILQSLGQAQERWGEHDATAMWHACTAKLIFGGLSSARDLDDICKVCPEVDEPVVSRSRGRDGQWSDSTSPRPMPSLTPDYLRELPASTPCSSIRACARWRPSSATGGGASVRRPDQPGSGGDGRPRDRGTP